MPELSFGKSFQRITGKAKPGNRLFPEAVPKLRNGQAMAHVTGYAYDSDHNLAYIGLVGYKTSLESLRVTIMMCQTAANDAGWCGRC